MKQVLSLISLSCVLVLVVGCKSIPANYQGLKYYSEGNLRAALEKFDDALVANTNYRFARNNRGTTNYLKGNYSEALNDYEVAINRRNNYANARNNRSVLFVHRGDDDRALVDLGIAIESRQDYKEAYLNRARVSLSRHELDRALDDINTAIAYHTDDDEDADWAEAYYLRAMIHQQLGDRQSADIDFDRAMTQDPDVAWTTEDPYPTYRVAGLMGE